MLWHRVHALNRSYLAKHISVIIFVAYAKIPKNISLTWKQELLSEMLLGILKAMWQSLGHSGGAAENFRPSSGGLELLFVVVVNKMVPLFTGL